MFYTQTPKGLLTTRKWLWIYKASQDEPDWIYTASASQLKTKLFGICENTKITQFLLFSPLNYYYKAT